MKSNKDMLHAICTIQVKLNIYIHELKKKLFVHMVNEDEKIHFVKYEG